MKPGLLGLIGALTALAAIAADTLLLHVPFVRNGWWTYVPLGAGLAFACVAVAKRRAWTTIAAGAATVLLVGFYTMTRLLAAPASPPSVGAGDAFPEVDLPDQEGRPVHIGGARKGPLVVVLFRGSW